MTNILLSRDEFRNAVFERDGYRCVFCGNSATAAHHILERKLWSDEGYYISNGASVCDPCHIKCESTEISVEEVRAACGITEIILPEHLYRDNEYTYDKWGNIILADGRRLKGELFHDESVQKILARGNKLGLFTKYVKHPRTMHCLWSEKLSSDDKYIGSMQAFETQRVIVSEKLDGSQYSVYNDYLHSRSVDSKGHPAQDWLKNFAASFMYEIPEGWRICGESLVLKHAIKYTNLPTFFFGFSMWNELNECLSWDETQEWFHLLDITPVPVLYDGIYDEEKIKALWSPQKAGIMEGYVIRVADSFVYRDFKHKVAKFVNGTFDNRHNFLRGKIEKNELQ